MLLRFFAATVVALASFAPLPARAVASLSVTGPTLTAFDVGGTYLNPNAAASLPVTYTVATTGWTTVRVTVRDGDGNTVRNLASVGTAGGSYATAWDGRDASGVAVPDGAYTIVADPAGYVYDHTLGEAGSGIGALQLPLGVDVAPDGSVWVADFARVVHFAADGTYLGSFPYSRPSSLRMDNDGTFWVLNGSNVATRHDAITGAQVGQMTLPAGHQYADVAHLSNGNYLFGRYNPNCCWTLHRWSNNLTTDLGTIGPTAVPRAVIEGASGNNHFVGENAAVYTYNQSGTPLYGNGAICFGGSCPGLNVMYGLTRGEEGGPLVSMYVRHQIAELPEFSPTALWAIGTNGSLHGQLEYPYGISRVGDRLYIADQYNNRVEVYRRSASRSATVIVDSQGPRVGTLSLARSEGGGAIATITADDTLTGGSPIAAAEIFDGSTGPNGTGQPLYAQDSTWDSSVETLFAYLAPRAPTRLYVHAKDAAGNWGPFVSFDVTIAGPPASVDVTASQPTVLPGGLPSGQRATAAVRDDFGNPVSGAEVTFSLCPPPTTPGVCAIDGDAVITGSNGSASWDVPPGMLLQPGTYTLGASVGPLFDDTTFDVLVGSP